MAITSYRVGSPGRRSNRYKSDIMGGAFNSRAEAEAAEKAWLAERSTDTVKTLTNQILGQNITDKWSGEGFGSAESNAMDMAKILAGIGITDIRQFGQVKKTVPADVQYTLPSGAALQKRGDTFYKTISVEYGDGGSYEQAVPLAAEEVKNVKATYGRYVDSFVGDGDNQQYVRNFEPVDPSKIITKDGVPSIETGETTYGNKVTGQQVPNTYSERQTGNAWGGTFAGDGNTGYRVQFTPDGTPIFYTTGASSNDLANLLGDNKLLNIAANMAAAYFGGPAGTAALQLAQGADIEDAAKAAVLTYIGNEVSSMVAGSDAVVDALGKTGAQVAGNTAAAIATGQDPEKALLASLVQAAPIELGKQFPDFAKLPRAAQEAAVAATVDLMKTGGDNLEQAAILGLSRGATDYALSQIDGYKDLRPAQQEIVRTRVSNVLGGESLSTQALQGAISLGREAAKNETKTGGITNRVVDETIPQGGVEQKLADAGLTTGSGQFPDAGSLSDEDVARIAGVESGTYTGVNVAGPGDGVASGTFVPSWLSLASDERIVGTGTTSEGQTKYYVERVNPNNPEQFTSYSVDRDPVTGKIYYGTDSVDASGNVFINASQKKPTVDWDAKEGSGPPPPETPIPPTEPGDATLPDGLPLDFFTKSKTPVEPTLDDLLRDLSPAAPPATPPVEQPKPVEPTAPPATTPATTPVTAPVTPPATPSDATSNALGDVKAELAKEIQAAKDIGLAGDAALQAGLDSMAAKMGVNQAEVLKQIGVSADTLRKEFGTGLADVTAAQKAEAEARAAQGKELQGAITGVAGQVTGLEGKLTAQGKAFADQLVQQGMDYKAALQTAIDAQTAVFGTQIGSVQADIAANEARRIADQQAAAAAAAAQRQADQKAAATQARQANIRTTATQAQASTRDIMQQLEDMQRAGMTPQQAQLVEAGPGFDLSDPLNTGFFSGFQAKKAQQNQQAATKIAAGGYIDDLLAEGTSVDDLMNLLR
jgi:hypothetical protein